MSTAQTPTNAQQDAHANSDERTESPPAFLDLADSAARLGTNMPDMSARVELKRMEHERQRAIQRQLFENQMRALEQQQQKELLSIPHDSSANQHIAASAPTTPPRGNGVLPPEAAPLVNSVSFKMEDVSRAPVATSTTEKRKSVRYAPDSPEMLHASSGFSRIGHKSMPASRRTSAGEHDPDLADHLKNLSLIGESGDHGLPHPITPSLSINGGKFPDMHGNAYGSGYNASVLLDEQLDQEMHNAMRNLPTPADDKFSYSGKISQAALDLAQKASDWPYEGSARGPSDLMRGNRRVATNPILAGMGDKVPSVIGGTPLLQQGIGSRRGSPLPMSDSLASMAAAARSVPGTPLGGVTSSVAQQLLKSGAATPLLSDLPSSGTGRPLSYLNDSPVSASDLQASLARLGNGQYDNAPLTFNSISGRSGLDEVGYDGDGSFGLSGGMDNGRFNGGSTALYGNGPRYGLGMGGRPSPESKFNGMHGPKHKRGEIDREYNRFAGTRIEDLVGEISSLCKDQHGCRYLQKKLEEGSPEHRDMIFRETFSQFADLMTDPFGNYLCQKLLEFSSDEQRNLICESVAPDLVNISLNMHGTRAVQKMIDYLSTRRQIHSIIVALSLHVVVLIKDLNGNHVIQKCLNKLVPEDNQFIYNAVAANCVEVATHRHGCCVLQRCVDHASDNQRVQLVNEITYNALTLVQDPYGNYVVQYVLDLNDNRFSDGVIRQFSGNVCALSVQKFSSNVIEKCIRVGEPSTRKFLVEEMLNRTRLEKLLRDSYGNYCVQTALDYADPHQRARLVDGIRPVLPLIRNTPYGKRIQNKLQREHLDHYGGGGGGGGAGGNGGGYSQPMGMSPHALGMNRHLPPQMHGDAYAGQGNLYSMGGGQLGGMMGRQMPAVGTVDPYILSGTPQGLGHSQAAFSTYGNPGAFGNGAPVNLSSYNRAFGGYGM